MQIGLGTASFGMKYGVANEQQVNAADVKAILNVSKTRGVAVIDTAQLYGDAEKVLGQSDCLDAFKVVTKLDRITDFSQSQLEAQFETSLARLKQDALYAVMLHRGDDLLSPNAKGNWDKLQQLKSKGLVSKIGVSVYTPKELTNIMEQFELDIVQLPLNLLDQRFIESGVLARAKRQGIEIHVRSAFLQGLLLMEPKQIPDYFAPFQSQLAPLSDALKQHNVSAMALALAFFKQIKDVDVLILGTNSQQQWLELLDTVDALPEQLQLDFHKFASSDENLILPTNWQVQ